MTQPSPPSPPSPSQRDLLLSRAEHRERCAYADLMCLMHAADQLTADERTAFMETHAGQMAALLEEFQDAQQQVLSLLPWYERLRRETIFYSAMFMGWVVTTLGGWWAGKLLRHAVWHLSRFFDRLKRG